MKKSTHIETIRDEMATQQLDIQQLLGWTESDYAHFVESCGLEYLLERSIELAPLGDKMAGERLFWSWWRMHWMRRDREWLDLVPMLFAHEYESSYRDIHEPAEIRYYPGETVLKAVAS